MARSSGVGTGRGGDDGAVDGARGMVMFSAGFARATRSVGSGGRGSGRPVFRRCSEGEAIAVLINAKAPMASVENRIR